MKARQVYLYSTIHTQSKSGCFEIDKLVSEDSLRSFILSVVGSRVKKETESGVSSSPQGKHIYHHLCIDTFGSESNALAAQETETHSEISMK